MKFTTIKIHEVEVFAEAIHVVKNKEAYQVVLFNRYVPEEQYRAATMDIPVNCKNIHIQTVYIVTEGEPGSLEEPEVRVVTVVAFT